MFFIPSQYIHLQPFTHSSSYLLLPSWCAALSSRLCELELHQYSGVNIKLHVSELQWEDVRAFEVRTRNRWWLLIKLSIPVHVNPLPHCVLSEHVNRLPHESPLSHTNNTYIVSMTQTTAVIIRKVNGYTNQHIFTKNKNKWQTFFHFCGGGFKVFFIDFLRISSCNGKSLKLTGCHLSLNWSKSFHHAQWHSVADLFFVLLVFLEQSGLTHIFLLFFFYIIQ